MFDLFIAFLLACTSPNPPAYGPGIHPIVRPITIGGGVFRPMADQDTTGSDGTGGDGGHTPPGGPH